MRRIYLKSIFGGVITAFLFLAGCQTSENVIAPEKNDQNASYFGEWQPIEGQYIVTYKDGEISQLVNARTTPDFRERTTKMEELTLTILRENQLADRELTQVYASAINGFAVKLAKAEKDILLTDSRIAHIEQDQFIPFEKPPWAGGGDDEGSAGQEIPWGITRVNGGVDGTGKTAWVIDTGVDLDHPDLNVDTDKSRTFVSTGRDSKDPDDNDGHGSHVAGTIAAIDNEIGVIGVAAGATVVAVKVLGPRGGSLSDVIAGVDYVGAEGNAGDVANMSLGGGASDALDQAVLNASSSGIIFAIAAGNSSDDANNYSPARVNGNYIYTISAMDQNDQWASFSNYGNPPIDYCDPGVSVLSTYKNGEYRTLSGTSMAAPHAAGVLLLGNGSTGGNVIGDPDGDPDPILVH